MVNEKQSLTYIYIYICRVNANRCLCFNSNLNSWPHGFYISVFLPPCFAVAAGPSGSSKGVASSTKSSTKRTIQEMEEKSEAFKSLFTTHSSAKRTKDQTSNWVTHTPYHF